MSRAVARVSFWGVIVSVALLVLAVVIAAASGSLTLTAAAVDCAVDVVTALVPWLGLKLAERTSPRSGTSGTDGSPRTSSGHVVIRGHEGGVVAGRGVGRCVMIARPRIREWLAAYEHAWSTTDPDDVGAVFTDDALYFTAPFQEPLRGIEEIAAYWLGEKEAGIPWAYAPEVVAHEGDLYVVRAVTSPSEEAPEIDEPEAFHNLWLVTLGTDGRAVEFIEYYTPAA